MEHSILTLIAVFRYRRIMHRIDLHAGNASATVALVHAFRLSLESQSETRVYLWKDIRFYPRQVTLRRSILVS